MKTNYLILAIVIILLTNCLALAERSLDRAEILQIFEQLTSQPRKTWIPAGTIKATHEEYRAPGTTDIDEINSRIKEKIAEYQSKSDKRELTKNQQKMKLDALPFNVRYELSNEYTMNSTVIVRFDGERFYWEINADSRTDSIKPEKDLSENFMTEQFNLDWNARRIFAWDGEKYTTYFLPGNHAIVDTTGSKPHVVNGPLTAGLIPWGYGYYAYENLSIIESSGEEKYIDGQTQIYLTLNNQDGSEMLFIMDPAKDYSVLSYIISDQSNTVISKQYSNYQSVSGNWVPTTILIERYEAGSNRLLAHDIWNITGIDANAPESYKFEVSYETDALIEYFSTATDESSMYRHSQRVDTDLLLAERLAFAVNQGIQPQNCATISLKYVKHFVVLDSIDDKYVWTIDLASNKFYYRTDMNFFEMDWTEGTTLLVSSQSITGEFTDIDESELGIITGAYGYQCNTLRQESGVIFCVYIGGGCEGYFRIFYERWGCGVAESGSCSQSKMIRYHRTPCILDPHNPFGCKVTGEWTTYYMQACS